jgi:hypothetical protein
MWRNQVIFFSMIPYGTGSRSFAPAHRPFDWILGSKYDIYKEAAKKDG